MISRLFDRLRAPGIESERGAILVITSLVMVAAIIAASYAIDTAVWFVHQRHLQTQADAAALAASQAYQFNCGSTGDTTISNIVHQYDGTGLGTLSPTYNPQVTVSPTPSSTSGSGHAEYSQVNKSDFMNQAIPADTGLTGSPCSDGLIDVKMTEQNLPSYIVPGIGPTYVNAQAQVGFQTAASTGGGLPFIEPLPTPSAVAVEFVDENNGDVLSTPGVVSLSSPSSGSQAGVTWSATGVNINFADPTNGSTTDTFPVGMRVAYNPTGGAATFPCAAPEICYDNSSSTSNTGVAFTRVWSNSGSPGINGTGSGTTNPVAPQASDVWLQPCTVSGSNCSNSCPSTPSPSPSNFFASSSATSEQLCAKMVFTSTGGTSLTCSQAGLTAKAGGTAVAMNCPTGGPNGTWSSGPLTVPAYSPPSTNNGVMNITMGWSVQNGCLPVGASGGTSDNSKTCTQGSTHTKCDNGHACTGSFDGNSASSPETVQQAYSGAYSLSSGQSIAAGGLGPSNSGTISAAAVTNSAGNEIQSIQNGTNSTGDTVSVSFYGFATEATVGGPPFELTLGGNQGNGDLGCNGNGVPAFELAIETGCPGTYASNSLEPESAACPNGSTNATPGPATCVNTNPGNGKSKNITWALNTKINGSKNALCTSPNYWTSPNSVGQILAQQLNGQPDPRLVTLFYTDNMTLPNGSSNIPIRGFAEFYITGWGGGDPCLSRANGGSGTSGTNSSGFAYTTDDLPPDNTDGVVMGHFVTYINSYGTGSGTKCVQGTLAICVPVLLK
jgi:hypothetical protein